MKKLFDSIINSLSAKEPLVMVSVIASSGSTPRGAGAMMLVHKNGKTEGTIGGGVVEHEAFLEAKKLFFEEHSLMKGYILSPNNVADLGMICGGNVTVYFQYLQNDKHLELFKYLADSFNQNANAWLIRRLQGCEVTNMAVCDDKGLHFATDMSLEKVEPLLLTKAVFVQGKPSYYVEPVCRSGRTYVFGGGHVSQELVPLIAHLGFAPVVFEDREQFADKNLFPSASDIVLGNFGNISEHVQLQSNDYAVIMTRGHQADYEILRQVLKTDATYIGCIGSRQKIELTKNRLMADGFTAAAFRRVHAPIGLDIKGETPAEIAISIAAEMILHRATKN